MKLYQIINGRKITPHGGCEDNGCIRNYRGSCLIGRAEMVGCPEKHLSSKQTTKPQGKCKWCYSENGYWSSIYEWHCKDCGKVTID